MKKLFLFLFSLALVLRLGESFDFHEKELETEEKFWELYERWRSHHTVSRSLDEKHKRFNVFKANVHYVHNFNKKDKPYKLKLNKFADMTNHEFRQHYAGSKIKHHRTLLGASRANGTFMYTNEDNVPPSIDWRKKGAVTQRFAVNRSTLLGRCSPLQPTACNLRPHPSLDIAGDTLQLYKIS